MHFIKYILSFNVWLGIRSKLGISRLKFNLLGIKIEIEAVLKTVQKIKITLLDFTTYRTALPTYHPVYN